MAQGSCTVLIVDANAEASDLYQQCLMQDCQNTYRFWQAASGQAGLSLWQQQPDVVLLNNCLPDRDGLTFLAQLPASSLLLCPVIVITDASSDAIALPAIEAGAEDCLSQADITPARLQLAVKKAIARAQRLKTNELPSSGHLSLNDERLVQLAENINAAFWITELLTERRTSYVSPAFERLWGLDPQAICRDQQVWVNLLHPDDRDRVDQAFHARATAGKFDEEYRIRLPDGTMRWIRDRCFPVHNALGKVYRLTGMTEDITDRKQTEAKLRQQAQILDQTHDSVITTDLDGYITRWNGGAERIFGYTATEALGQSVAMLYPSDMEDFLAHQAIALLKAEGKHEVEVATQRKSGRRITVRFSLSLLRDEDQNAIGMIGYAADISDRKQSEQALQEYQQLLQLAMEGAHAGSWNLEIATGKVVWSPENYVLFGLDPAQAIVDYADFYNMLHPDDRDRITTQVTQIVNQGLPELQIEFRIIHPQRGIRWLQGIGRLTVDDRGNPLRLSGINLDITERKQAEVLLTNNEARLQGFVDANVVGIVYGDIYGNIYQANDEFLRIVGHTQTELATGLLRGRNFTPSEYAPLDEQKTVEAQAQGACTPYEKEYIRKNGKRVAVLVGFSSLGEFREEVVAFVLDLTEQKRAERALRRSQDRLRMAIESAQIGTWDWNLTNNKLVYDAGCKAMFGLQPKTKVNIETFFINLHPDDRGRVEQAVQRSLDSFDEGSFNEEYRVVSDRDGVERWILAKGQAYFTEDQTPRRFMGTVMDITNKKQAEFERQQTQAIIAQQLAEIEAIYQATPVGLGVLDRNLQYTRINHRLAEINGMSIEEHIGQTISVIVPELAPSLEPYIQHVLTTGEPQLNVEVEGETAAQPSIKRTWVNNWFPLKGSDEQVIGVSCVVYDITDRKRIESQRERLLQREHAARQAAERANRIKDEFLAILSHELRSPLNPILGWSKLLQTRKLDEAKTARALQTIERNAKLQTQLIDDLLDVARILRGKLKLEQSLVSLPPVIEAAVETVKTAAIAKSIEIQAELVDVGKIWGDTGRLQQIVWNLLSNAIKFTPSGGTVKIQLEQNDRQAHIIVTDTGKGISAQFLPHIFQSFRQEDASITRQHGGLGLGLAIVQHLVEAHGGTVMADSRGEGQGASFTASFPLTNGERRSHHVPDLQPTDIDLSGIRVLAVDDNPDARELLTTLLAQQGADVQVVSTASDLLANLMTVRPNILVCDIGMPDLDGYGLMQKIRSRPPEQGGQTPAIALTAYVREGDKQYALACGYQKHLAKPVDVDELIRAIAALLK